MVYTPGLWLFILSSIILAGIIIYSFRFRKTEIRQSFIFLMTCALIWSLLFTIENTLTSLEAKLLLAKLELLGITFLPVAWVYLVLDFTGEFRSRKIKALFLPLPILTNIIVWTNPLHHWYFGSPRIIEGIAPFPVIDLDFQFWFYYVHAVTSYLFMVFALVILFRSMFKMGRIYRIQAGILLVAILLPSITDISYVLGLSPVKYYNFTTAVFSISGLLLIWGLFRFRFLDLLPLARDLVIDNLDDGVVILDHKKRLVYSNPAASKNFHINIKEFGQEIDYSQNSYLQNITMLFKDQRSKTDIEFGKDPVSYYDLRISEVKNRSELLIGWVVTSREITERIELFKQVQDLSIRDNLTGIFNRRQFMELGQRELQRLQHSPEQANAVIMIDLDNFKRINDSFGHIAGDKALIAFTKTVQEQLREFDLFGRLGGEEFAIILNDVNKDQAFAITERLRNNVEALNISYGDAVLKITASFGVISSLNIKTDDLKIEKMLHLADQALYQAKQTGRNRVMLYGHERPTRKVDP